jgi:hypothetical protein
MKYTIALLFTATVFYCCTGNSQTKAAEKVTEIQVAIKPGTVAVSGTAYVMTAKINGKEWAAASMIPPQAAGRIIGYYNDEYIGLPYSKSSLVKGKIIVLGEDEAADLFIKNGCLFKDVKGKIEIIKADENSAEGKFYFTTVCSSTNIKFSVTDGFFRIPIAK